MAGKRPAKIADRTKVAGSDKFCPKCTKKVVPIRLMRAKGSSGMFWVCESCGWERATQ